MPQTEMKTFKALLAEAKASPLAVTSADANVAEVSADSRRAGPGALFVCMPSPARDTHGFLDEVAAHGASAALVHSQAGFQHAQELGLAAALIEPGAFFRAAGLVAHAFLEAPTVALKTVGITGTNGKTTTAYMMRSALAALGGQPAYLGTLGFDDGSGIKEIANTTPWPVELAAMAAKARAGGCRHLVMEASSHALAEERLAGVVFDAAIFTNLTQDHLDFHKTMKAYEAAKYRLFSDWRDWSAEAGKPFVACLNLANEVGRRWAAKTAGPQITFGPPESGASLQVRPLRAGVESLKLRAQREGATTEISLPVGGLFNIENASACLAGLLALGHSLDQAGHAMGSVRPVPGRFEPVPGGDGYSVLVDYAHTPDAIELLLQSVRQLSPSRIITVFGCGGDRDRTKRPLMAAAASRLSDVVVATSDNPRSEDPMRILDDVAAGLSQGSENHIIPDRAEAVAKAVQMARQGDVVVLAGKGHEKVQIIGSVRHPMDDADLARKAMAARGSA